MKFQKFFFLAVVVMTFSLGRGHVAARRISLQDIEPQVYCGRGLSRALGLICNEEFTLNYKRGIGSDIYKLIMSQLEDPILENVWKWLFPNPASLSLPSRNKRYIVDDCCDKPCSVTELVSYC